MSTTIFLNCSKSGPSSRRQAPVESESLPVIRCPTQESRGAGTRSCASSRPARWQRRGQRNQRRKRATAGAEVRTGCVWATAPPIAHAGRSLDVSRWRVGRIAPGAKTCEDPRSATEFSNRSRDPVVEDVEIDKALVACSNDCLV